MILCPLEKTAAPALYFCPQIGSPLHYAIDMSRSKGYNILRYCIK